MSYKKELVAAKRTLCMYLYVCQQVFQVFTTSMCFRQGILTATMGSIYSSSSIYIL